MTTDPHQAGTTVPPSALFVAADEPLIIYPSVAEAERHIEAVDVENGVYPAAYGPNGEPFLIRSAGKQVIIEPTGKSNSPDELRRLLLGYLEATGRAPDAAAQLHDLVAEAWAVDNAFWQEHDPYGDRFSTPFPAWGCIAFVVAVALVLYVAFR